MVVVLLQVLHPHVCASKIFYPSIYNCSIQSFCLSGCPKVLQAQRIVCDAFLLMEIEDLRQMGKQTAGSGVVEDFTMLPEGAEDDEE